MRPPAVIRSLRLTLHRNHGRAHGVVRNVSPCSLWTAGGSPPPPGCRIAHDQEVFRPHPVHDEVIDGASVFLASQSYPSHSSFMPAIFGSRRVPRPSAAGPVMESRPMWLTSKIDPSFAWRGVPQGWTQSEEAFPPSKRDEPPLLTVPGEERSAIQSILGHAHRVAMPDCRSCRNDLNQPGLWLRLGLYRPPFLVEEVSGECRCHSPNCQKPASAPPSTGGSRRPSADTGQGFGHHGLGSLCLGDDCLLWLG